MYWGAGIHLKYSWGMDECGVYVIQELHVICCDGIFHHENDPSALNKLFLENLT